MVYSLWEDMNNSMFCSWKIGRETESLGNYLVHHEAEKRLNTKKVFFFLKFLYCYIKLDSLERKKKMLKSEL